MKICGTSVIFCKEKKKKERRIGVRKWVHCRKEKGCREKFNNKQMFKFFKCSQSPYLKIAEIM